MRILIVDDEQLARERLADLLADCGGAPEVRQAENGLTAISISREWRPEIVLLDIRMPGMDGLETAQHLGRLPEPPAVVFTTAYDEHALQAFDASAVDYLLKPVRRERLVEALDKGRVMQQARLAELRRSGVSARARTRLSIRSHDGILLVPVEDVAYLRAEHKYVSVGLVSSPREVLLDEPLKDLEQEFADRFLRIHRNALVARQHIRGLEKQDDGGYGVRLQGCADLLAVSRRHLGEVRESIRHIDQ